jgi:hypothetical protein
MAGTNELNPFEEDPRVGCVDGVVIHAGCFC